jgi:hypothetical protein
MKSIPLTIGAPVVLPVECRWPLISGEFLPPDPRLVLIDASAELLLDVTSDVFLTFEGCIGFYLLTNRLLRLIMPEDFDIAWASSHLPQIHGGLKVCYIHQTMEPNMPHGTISTGTSHGLQSLRAQEYTAQRGRAS